MKNNSYEIGLFSEWIARNYLRLHGFGIIENRYITGRNTGRAEIDIIARRGNLIIFVEVKNRTTVARGLESVTFAQSVRLRRAAETYMLRKRWMGNARFDIIFVRGLRVRWFKNAV